MWRGRAEETMAIVSKPSSTVLPCVPGSSALKGEEKKNVFCCDQVGTLFVPRPTLGGGWGVLIPWMSAVVRP